ncbi:leucine rich repeat domain-containing protein [Flagelloscypha sp. PMI_526]|nr:leucine rich repeat domain-containing protein [Flagelloscypha sp. PMI_526]
MEPEPGDAYIRRFATFIRNNEKGLAQAAVVRHRRQRAAQSEGSSLFPFFATQPIKPVVLSISTHHLFYLLIRLEALGLPIGSLDVRVQSPSRPMSFVNIFQDSDKSDTLSLSSIRSSLSVVSSLSLGTSWWSSRYQERPLDDDLRYVYSSFTKIPALSITPPSRKMIQELANEPPNQNALPLVAFKNLQFLEITEVDPRTLLGWGQLADSLISLKIKSSGIQDIADVFINAVTGSSSSRRNTAFHPAGVPESVPEDEAESHPDAPVHQSPINDDATPALPPWKWSMLHTLSLPSNDLTFFPSSLLPLPPHAPIFSSLTSLDLSSNLLVSVPPSLSSLVHLRTVNLADNMIDSVLHIYQNVGSIQSINLAKNRLSSICGLERLMALETSEIGRLATVPNIRSIHIDLNPLCEDDNYRVACFDLFLKEGKEILLDGTGPGILEPPSFIPASPPTVAVGAPVTEPTPSTPSPPGSSNSSPQVQAVSTKSKKKKPAKRIVALDGNDSDNSTKPASAKVKKTGQTPPAASQYTHFGLVRPSADDITPKASQVLAPPTLASTPGEPSSPPSPPPRRFSRHARHQTEVDVVPEELTPTQANFSRRGTRNTIGSRASKRRARVTASVYEPSSGSGVDEDDRGEEIQGSAEAYRRRIEALKRDMGENWLRVFGQEAAQSRA